MRSITITSGERPPAAALAWRWLLAALLALGAFGLCPADAGADPILEAVDVRTLPGNRTQLRFSFSEPAPSPRSFTINEPARVVLDFPDTRNGLSTRRQAINVGAAESLTVLEGGDRTRASINLAGMVPYTVRREGNSVLLTLEGATRTPGAAPPRAVQTVPGTDSIGDVDFRRGTDDQAIVGITLSDPAIPVNVRQEGTRIVADFLDARVPRGQERRLDVTDFATPVTTIDVFNRGNDARVEIEPSGPYEYLAYQVDDTYTIEVRPVTPEEPRAIDDPLRQRFTGEPLSLNFQNIEVRAVLQILADFTGQNVVVSDTVQGDLTLRLQNVPWDQALAIILRTKGLTMRQSGNVIYVAPTEEVAARERLELEARQATVELAPLRTELIQVNYARAADLAAMIQAGVTGGAISLLSERGKVTTDERTNTLLVQDIAEKLSEIRELITRLDVPVRQVMIDARIVVANDDFSRELGVRYGFAGVARTGDRSLIAGSGSLAGTNRIITGALTEDDPATAGSAIGNQIATGQSFPVDVPPLNQRLGVQLPVGGATTRLALAILGQDYLVDLELSALQAEGRGEVLSNPRVITTDRQEAVIQQGREIPFLTVSDEGTRTEFRDAVLELAVIPQITPDDRIIMDLRIKQDELGREVSSGIAEGAMVPTIDKRQVNTQVLVNNGETVVLGGVFIHNSSRNVDKVPLLGDIPVVGRLFQRRSRSDMKLELLIFVTPQILTEEGMSAR